MVSYSLVVGLAGTTCAFSFCAILLPTRLPFMTSRFSLSYIHVYHVAAGLSLIGSVLASCFLLGFWSFFFYLILRYVKNWKTSAVSTTDWMVQTQLCKLRGTSDTFVGRAYSIFLLNCGRYNFFFCFPFHKFHVVQYHHKYMYFEVYIQSFFPVMFLVPSYLTLCVPIYFSRYPQIFP